MEDVATVRLANWSNVRSSGAGQAESSVAEPLLAVPALTATQPTRHPTVLAAVTGRRPGTRHSPNATAGRRPPATGAGVEQLQPAERRTIGRSRREVVRHVMAGDPARPGRAAVARGRTTCSDSSIASRRLGRRTDVAVGASPQDRRGTQQRAAATRAGRRPIEPRRRHRRYLGPSRCSSARRAVQLSARDPADPGSTFDHGREMSARSSPKAGEALQRVHRVSDAMSTGTDGHRRFGRGHPGRRVVVAARDPAGAAVVRGVGDPVDGSPGTSRSHRPRPAPRSRTAGRRAEATARHDRIVGDARLGSDPEVVVTTSSDRVAGASLERSPARTAATFGTAGAAAERRARQALPIGERSATPSRSALRSSKERTDERGEPRVAAARRSAAARTSTIGERVPVRPDIAAAVTRCRVASEAVHDRQACEQPQLCLVRGRPLGADRAVGELALQLALDVRRQWEVHRGRRDLELLVLVDHDRTPSRTR